MLYYPAILFAADSNGVSGCTVPDLLVNGSGRSTDAAMRDAAASVHELLADLARKGEPFPEPSPVDEIDLDGGTLVYLSATPPHVAA